MQLKPVCISEKLEMFKDQWSPKIIAQVNDHHLKVVKFQGDFVWHKHDNTDEIFLVVSGTMRMDLRDGPVIVNAGELIVIPREVEHKPYAAKECHVLVIEQEGTANTGNAGGSRTAPGDQWI